MNIHTPASRVWATPELRSFIIDQMDLDAVRKSLTLSRDTFPAMVGCSIDISNASIIPNY